MLQLLDFNCTKISMLENLKDYHIVETLDGNETLYFSLPIKDSQNNDIKLEYYVQNEKNRYVLKEKHSNGDWYEYVCQLDVDDLKISSSIYASGYSFYGSAYDFCLALESDIYSISGKTWSAETDIPDGEKDVSGSDSNMLGFLKNGAEVFGAEIKIDSINKKIYFNQKIGEDKGSYFIDDLNLKNIEIDSTTNDLITRLIPIGSDRLTISNINGGVPYVENKTYTTKNIYASWVDERYTDAESLKSDAVLKLSELCKPATTYTANIIDLASSNPNYSILSYSIGDTVTLFNRKENQKQTHRIVEIDKYPEEPHRNTCQLSSKAYSIIGVQKRSFKSTDSLQGKVGITKANGDGTVSTAVAGTDYATPAQVSAKQNKITASGILKGNGSGTISAAVAGTDYATPTTNLLWSGTAIMNPNQTITLSQPVSKQNKGIVLVFSEFNPSTNTAGNSMVSSHFVSKYEVSALSGVGHLFTTFATWGKAMAKYLYITDTTIRGHDANDNTGTATNGILYDNTCYVLRYVIGV